MKQLPAIAPMRRRSLVAGDEPTLLGDFSSSPDTLQLNLSKLRECPDYGAATLDTVDFATRLLKDRHNNYRRAILLIGETRDHGSQAKLQDVVSSLGVTNTVIYSVAFSPSRDEVIAQLRSSDEGVPEESVPRRDLQPPTRPPISSTPESAAAGDKATKQPPTLELPPLLLLIINALRKMPRQNWQRFQEGSTSTSRRRKDLTRVYSELRIVFTIVICSAFSHRPKPTPLFTHFV